MIKKIFFIFFIILLITVSLTHAQIPTFTETFGSSGNLSSYNFLRTGGWAYNNKIHAYYRTSSWRYQWGDITYYNGYIYAVWADNREDGVNHIYIDKIDKNGNHIWATNFSIDEMLNPCYRPKIAIADLSRIYIVYIEDQTEYRRFYAMRIQDNGTSITKMWANPVKLDAYNDPKFAYSGQYKTSCDVIGNNLIAFMNQSWSGSWGYESLRFIREDGTLGGESHGYVTGNHGSYGSDLLVNGGNRFVTVRERYYWGGKDEGIWGRRWQTNSSGGLASVWGGQDLDAKGTVLSGAADQNLSVLDCDGTDFFVVWNDRRNGNHDIFLGKYLYSDGSRSAGFDPEIRVNISTAGDQKNPDMTKDYLNLLYIVWADANSSPSWQLEMMKLQDDGVKKFGGDFTLERSATESYIRGFNPRIVSDNTNLYVAWYQYGGSDDYRVMLQKYDSSGVRLWTNPVSLIQGTYMRQSHGESKKLTFVPQAATIKEVMVTNFVKSEPGDGQAKLYLSNNAGANWFLATNGKTVLFTNTSSGGYLAGWDFRYKIVFQSDGLGAQPGVDGFTLKAYQYYTGDFMYTINTNLNYAGSNVLEALGNSQSMTNYILADGVNKGLYYIKLENTGNGAGNFYIYGEAGGGNFDVKYYAGSQDITANITSWTGYLVNSLGALSTTNIRVEVTPSANTYEGEYYAFYVYSYVGKASGIHDSLKLTAYSWKYRPDLLIKRNSSDSYIGNQTFERTTTVLTQRIGTNANSYLDSWEELHTNYVVLKNSGISNDIITFSTQLVSGDLSHWSIQYTNITKGISFIPPTSFSNIPAGQSNQILMIHKPLSSASVDEFVKLRFQIKSEKTAVNDDPLRLDYAFWSNQAKKYEPDAIITFDNFTISSGDNIYYYTNTSVTQTILKKTVPGTPLYFNLIVQNDADNDDNFNIKIDSIQSNGWTTWYSNNGKNILHGLTNASGTNVSMSAHTSMTILCKYLTTTNVPSGQWHNLQFQVRSLSKPFYQDVCFVRPYNKILRPDLIVATNTNNWLGETLYSSTGIEQSYYTRLESQSEDTQVYYVKVKNNSQTDPDTIYFQGTAGDNHWHISYFTNGIDITSFVTQSMSVSLDTNKFKLIRAVVKVDPTAIPDEIKVLQFHIWSSEVPSQEDWANFTNQAVELKPDLVVSGIGNGQYRTSTYEQTKYFEAISGITNFGTLSLQNDGGSIESFRLTGVYSNVGGSLTNWIISIQAGNTEISTAITNTGFLISNLSNYSATNLSLKIYSKKYSVGNTNSAVGNFLYLKFQWSSETKNIRRDVGQIENEIKRGLVDSYIVPGNVSYGIVITNFSPTTNRYILGIVPGYSASADFYMKNIGIYTDVFNAFVAVSNNSSSWIFSITNLEDNSDVSSIITNQGSPYVFTNKNGYSKSLRLTLDATNGSTVGTKIYFKNYFQTSTKWERKDRSYIMGIIVNGLPDIAITNIQQNQLIGWGKDASVESTFDKIEENETNVYYYLLHNDVVGGSNANFIFKETSRNGDASNVQIFYYTNNILIPNSDISNGVLFNINSGSNVPVQVKVVLPATASGTKVILKNSLTLQGYSQVEDTFILTNRKVNPNVFISFLNSTIQTQILSSTNGTALEYNFFITNKDVVAEQFYVVADSGTSDWQVAYSYYNPSLGSYSNITAVITNSGFLTPNLVGNEQAKFKVNLFLSTNLYGETNKLFHIQTFSLKNNSRSNSIDFGAVVKDGIADLYGTNLISSSVEGFGHNAGQEFLFDSIEVNETNQYRIYLRNEDPLGSAVFFFKQIYAPTNSFWQVQYFDSSHSLLSYFDMTNGFFVTNAGGTKDYVDVYIRTTNTNLISGAGIKLAFKMNLKDYNNKNDTFSLTNQLVKPDVYIGFHNTTAKTSMITSTNNHIVSFRFIITNKDLISSPFYLKGEPGNSLWSNVYYYDKNPDPLYETYTNISSLVTSSTGYLTKTIVGSTSEEFKVDLVLSSNIPGMSSNLFRLKAYTHKNYSISNRIFYGALIHDGTPVLIISNHKKNILSGTSSADKIQLGQTNIYTFQLSNNETAGRGRFVFEQSQRIGDDSWSISYYTNNTLLSDVTNSGYKLWLNAGETKTVDMKIVVTNTNLISSSMIAVKNNFYLSNYASQRYVQSMITNTLIKPGVSIYLKNISKSTLFKTNNQRVYVKIAVKNNDLVKDRFVIHASSGVFPWQTVYSNSTNNITSLITNTSSWTSASLGAYAEDYIRCYVDLDSSLGGYTNKTYTFTAFSVADNSKNDSVEFSIVIIDGDPILQVEHNSTVYSTSPEKEKIESFETNSYVLILSNGASKGSGDFVYRTFYESKQQSIIEYSTNNWLSTIPSSNLISGLNYQLSGGESRRILMRVSTSNNCSSGTKILNYGQLYLKSVPGFVDKMYITNIAVSPQLGLLYEDGTIGTNYLITTNNRSYSYKMLLKNLDKVAEYARFRCVTGNDSDWQLEFIDNTSSQTITSAITSATGWLSPELSYLETEQIEMILTLSSNLYGNTNYLVQMTSYPIKNNSITTNLYLKIHIEDGTPNVQVTNLVQGAVKSNSWFDRIEIGQTNSYIFKLKNIESRGSGTFGFKEFSRDALQNWEISYYDGMTKLSNVSAGYYFNLTGNQTKEIRMQVTLTNTNLSSGEKLILNNLFYLSNYQTQRVDSFMITNKFVKPGVSIWLDNISSSTVFWTNNQTKIIRLKLRNDDVEPDNIIVKGTSGTGDWVSIYSNSGNDITGQMTNVSGWTSSSYAGYAVDTIKLYTQLDSNLSGMTNKQYYFKAYSLNNTARTDSCEFTISIVDGTPKLDVYNQQTFDFSTNVYEKIERFETNSYVYVLSNIASSGTADFVFQGSPSGDHGVFQFFTNIDSNPIITNVNFSFVALSEIQNGLILRIPSMTRKLIKVKVSSTNAPSGELEKLDNFRFYLNGYITYADFGTIRNRIVYPQVDFVFNDTVAKTNVIFATNNQTLSYSFIIKNMDSVGENFRLRYPNANLSDWNLQFVSAYNMQDITSNVLSTNGWVTPELSYNASVQVDMYLTLSSNLKGQTNKLFTFLTAPLKNLSLESNLFLNCTVIDGLPNLSILSYSETNAMKFSRKGTNVLSFVYLLSNKANDGKADFKFKETTRTFFDLYNGTNLVSNPGFSVLYFTNSVPVSGTNFIVSLQGNSKIPLTVRIQYTNLDFLGKQISLKHKFFLLDSQAGISYPTVSDSFVVTNYLNNPYLSLKLQGYATNTFNITNITTNNQTLSYIEIISNNDVINGTYHILGSAGDSHWGVQYIRLDTLGDITSSVTNGFNMTVNPKSILKIKINYTLTTNLVGDDTNSFVFHVDNIADVSNLTKTHYYHFTIIDGLPDLIVYNPQSSLTNGAGVFTIENQKTFNKIEKNETNLYVLSLSNYAKSGGRATFYIKETNRISSGAWRVQYYDQQTNTLLSVSNGTYIRISGKQSTNLILKISSLITNLSSSNIRFNIVMALSNYPNINDLVTFSNIGVSPKLEVRNAGAEDAIWDFNGFSTNIGQYTTVQGSAISFYFAVQNQDAVAEQFILHAPAGNSKFSVSYYEDGPTVVDLTPMITTTGYTTKMLQPYGFYRLRCSVTPTLDTELGGTFTNYVIAQSLKNTLITATNIANVVVDYYLITGKITHAWDGSPIANATIVVNSAFGTSFTAHSDSNGNYAVNVYSSKYLYSVQIDADGFVGQEKQLFADSRTNVLSVALVPLNMGNDKPDLRLFPNPLSAGSSGNFVYSVTKQGHVSVLIYNMLGHLVRTLVDEEQSPGVYYKFWDGAGDDGAYLSRGIYIMFIKSADGIVRKKIAVK